MTRRHGLLLACAVAASCTTTSSNLGKDKDTDMKNPAQATPGANTLAQSAEGFTRTCNATLERARAAVADLRKLEKGDARALELYDEAVTSLIDLGAKSGLGREVHPDAAFRTAAEACEQQLEAFNVELAQDRAVYDVLASIERSTLDPKTDYWLFRTLREFRRAGVDRDQATREKVKALNEELVKVGQAFSKNIRDDVRTVNYLPAELEGLPKDFLDAHAPGADGTITVTTNTPDYLPVMTYAKRHASREKLWKAYRQRAYPQNESVLKRLLELRYELATLLGYENWAAFATEEKMAKNPQTVAKFIEAGSGAALARAKSDMAVLLARKQKDDPKATVVEPWEQDYYEDRVKAEQLGFDSQQLRAYFEYGNVKRGVMDITSRIFSIRFVPVQDAVVWHPDVETYDVEDATNGQRLGRIHLDMHPREGKYKHAANFGLTVGRLGKAATESVLVCNFPRPGGLMQHSDVETFFHEFGHLLHDVFAGRQRWGAQSGIRTEWDFVEVPSMLLQEWPLDPQVVALFGKHHQTGEPIPAALLAKLRQAREFGMGVWTRRQFFLAGISLAFHDRKPGFDSTALLKETEARFVPFRREWAPGTHFELAFGHLEGYSAGYYTYLWSTVIAKDLLTRFQEKGLLDPTVATAYRKKVLEPGGSREAAKLVEDFLGRPYDFKAYEAWLNSAR